MQRKPSGRIGRNMLVILGYVVSIALIAALLMGVIAHRQSGTSPEPPRALDGAVYRISDGQSGAIELPGSLDGLPARTAVTLYARLDAPAEYLLVKTVYTQLELYSDDMLIYACGQEGSYPAFLLDPPTILAIVPLPQGEGARDLRFEYLSATQRSTMSLPAIYAGDKFDLFFFVFRTNAFSLLFSLLLMMIGVVMIGLTLALMRGLPNATSFAWLGLFAIATGVWVFGECDLSAFILPYPSILYVLAFSGMFTMAIPLLQYGIRVAGPRRKWPMRGMIAVMGGAAIGAFALQLAGVVGLSRSMYVFHIIIPLALLVFTGSLLWEALRHKNQMARRFILPVLLLTASAVMEWINYRLRFTDILSLFFQMGVLLFVLGLGVIGGYFARDAMRAEADRSRLRMQIVATGRQLDLQRERYHMLTDNIATAKKARHDIHHQLAALKGYADRRDAAGMQAYLGEMIGALSMEAETPLCENHAVDAVVRHYLAQAEQKGIRAEHRLNVPEMTGPVLATDLCVVFGNLMENAIDACGYVKRGKAFMRIGADVRKGYLVITVENSFDGELKQKNSAFRSRKRNYEGEGIGVSSVRAIAEKYDGYAEFVAADGIFQSAALVKIQHSSARSENGLKNPKTR
jgi:hypothetical protein